MKQLVHSITLLSFLLFAVQLSGQSSKITKHADLWQPKLNEPAVLDAPAPQNTNTHPSNIDFNPSNDRTDVEVLIGQSIYDLQTNYSSAPRLFNFGNGELSAIWTMGFDAAGGYPLRGTGYNHFDGSDWGPIPSDRLEANVRTGWPSLQGTADGTEVIVNHIFGNPFGLHELRSPAGNPNWLESDIPHVPVPGVVWPRIAVGGADGNTIHAIGLTLPGANGQIYQGVDGHVLYYRSTNGGLSWDIVDMVLPGLDSSQMLGHSADAYAIDANGENVVVAVFGQWSDVAVWKSGDNGMSWERSVVNDFPFLKYQTDSGYTPADLPPDPFRPDSLAILTSDFSGAVILDNDNMAHVFYGLMYVSDADFTDGGTNYFPGTSGIAYWNETHGEDSIRVIADVIDYDGNGTYDVASIDDIATYFTSLTTFPSVGIDNQGRLFLAYSAVVENYWKEDANPSLQHYRHIFAIASQDNGATWTEPLDLINDEISSDPDLIPAIEAVFPSVARHVDAQMHMIWQFDFEPGMSVRGDSDPAENNFISYVALDLEAFGFTNTEEAKLTPIQLELKPNPATSFVNLDFELPATASVELTLYNLMGQAMSHTDLGTKSQGMHSTTLDLSTLSKGVYLLKVKAGNSLVTKKLIKN